MANNSNEGFEHRFAFAASPATFGSGSQRFELVKSTVKKTGRVIQSRGLLGTRDPNTTRTRQGKYDVGGQLEFDVSARMLDFFGQYVLGANESTDTFNVADGLPGFDMLHDPFGTGSSASLFSELYVNRFGLKLSNANEGLVPMTLDVIGKTFTGGQAYTSAALGTTAGLDDPYMFHDTSGGITIRSGSGAIEIEEAELIIENALDVKFRNSRTATSIRATDRVISLVTNLPLTTSTLSTYFGDKSAADATIVLDNGTVVTTITLFNLQVPDEGPEVGGKDEVPLILRGIARADASDPSIRMTVVGGSL